MMVRQIRLVAPVCKTAVDERGHGGSNPSTITMYGKIPFMSPYGGGSGAPWARNKKCECCKETMQPSKQMFGSGRFCSSLCATLRTPEAHFNWLKEHPEEFKAWQERHNKEIGASGQSSVVFPSAE